MRVDEEKQSYRVHLKSDVSIRSAELLICRYVYCKEFLKCRIYCTLLQVSGAR